jgi:CSLREA domain-containing protein
MKTILIIPVLLLFFALSAAAGTFTVNNILDPGNGTCDAIACTLREAITAANANPGADLINFNIPGAGVKTIAPTSALPIITEAVTIDGYTQPGAAENTLALGDDAVLLIELNGTSAGALTIGLNLTADGCLIRGLVINRFGNSGINLNSGGNVIEGNFVGTDAAGTADLGNSFRGVSITTGNGNLVGGLLPASRNLVSGNGSSGVVIFCCAASDNKVQGNYIGTDRTGTVALPNDASGITISNTALRSLIGGTDTGAGNLISGNAQHGIDMVGAGSQNVVQGNLIGTDITGTLDLGNNNNGVAINNTSGNTIGGVSVGARNIISGNNSSGVSLQGGAAANTVQGNYIGTDLSGSMDLGNSQSAVAIVDASANVIGGLVPGAGNLLSGNAFGVQISAVTAATGNTIQGNLIGTDATGAGPLGNALGILLFVNSTDTTIGGPGSARNIIAFNEDGGVAVNPASAGNTIFGNSIFANGNLGINLGGGIEDANGVTVNDFPDSDVGANDLQNYPGHQRDRRFRQGSDSGR